MYYTINVGFRYRALYDMKKLKTGMKNHINKGYLYIFDKPLCVKSKLFLIDKNSIV